MSSHQELSPQISTPMGDELNRQVKDNPEVIKQGHDKLFFCYHREHRSTYQAGVGQQQTNMIYRHQHSERNQENLSRRSSPFASLHHNRNISELLNQHNHYSQGKRGDEIAQLSHTVQNILKSSQGYRRDLLQAHQGNAQTKLQNTYLKTKYDALVRDKNVWDLERQQMQEMVNGCKSQQIILKRNYDQMIQNLGSERQKLQMEVQFQKKRVKELQVYNKQLFAKLTSKSGQEDALSLMKSKEEDLFRQISRLRSQIASSNQQVRKYQRDYESMHDNYRYLQNTLQVLQQERNSFKPTVKTLQNILGQSRSASKIITVQDQRRSKNRNFDFVKKQSEIRELEKKLQDEKTKYGLISRENDHLRRQMRNIEDELRVLKNHSHLLTKIETLKDIRETKMEWEYKSTEFNSLLTHEKAMRQQIVSELKRQQATRLNVQRQNEDLNEQIVEIQLEGNAKILQLSNVLLSEQEKIRKLENFISKKDQETKRLLQKSQLLQSELNEKQQNIIKKEEQVIKLSQSIRRLQSQISQRDTTVRELQVKIVDHKNLFQGEKTKKDRQNAQLRSNLFQMDSKLTEQIILRQRAQNNLNNYVSESNRVMKNQKTKFQLEINKVNLTNQLLQNEAKSLKERLEDIKTVTVEQQKTISQKSGELELLKMTIGEINSSVDSLKSQNQKVSGILNSTTQKYQELRTNNAVNLQTFQNDLQGLNKICENQNTNLEQQKNQIHIKTSTGQKLNQLILDLNTRIGEFQSQKLRLQEELNKSNKINQEYKLDLLAKQESLGKKVWIIEMLNQISVDFNQKLVQNSNENLELKAKSDMQSEELQQLQLRLENQQQELHKLSSLCETNQVDLKFERETIQSKESVEGKMTQLINDLKERNAILEDENKEFKNLIQLERVKSQRLDAEVIEKSIQLVQKKQQIQTIQLLMSDKSVKYQTQLLHLKGQKEQVSQKYNKMQENTFLDLQQLQQEINYLKAKERRFIAAEQILKSLYDQIIKSEHLCKEVRHYPPINGLKKFVPLINSTHRMAMGREVDKVLEYFMRVSMLQDQIGKHFTKMKLTFSLIDNQEFKQVKKKPKK